MAAKFVVVALMVTCAHGSSLHGSTFSYGVSDPHTGDFKNQHESRHGDNVIGQYSLLDSDGTKRTVHYAADGHSGFNAIVRKDPLIHHGVVHATPIAVAHAAPLKYAGHGLNHGISYGHGLGLNTHSVDLGHRLSHSGLTYGSHGLSHGAISYGTHGLGLETHGLGLETHGLGLETHGLGLETHGLGLETHGLGLEAHGLSRGVIAYGGQGLEGHGLTYDAEYDC